MASTLVGLEITEESVRAVEVKRGRTPVLLAAGEVALPKEAARDSEVARPRRRGDGAAAAVGDGRHQGA